MKKVSALILVASLYLTNSIKCDNKLFCGEVAQSKFRTKQCVEQNIKGAPLSCKDIINVAFPGKLSCQKDCGKVSQCGGKGETFSQNCKLGTCVESKQCGIASQFGGCKEAKFDQNCKIRTCVESKQCGSKCETFSQNCKLGTCVDSKQCGIGNQFCRCKGKEFAKVDQNCKSAIAVPSQFRCCCNKVPDQHCKAQVATCKEVVETKTISSVLPK